jgi:uncharacterized protein YyaL (SSP411 family)
MGVFRPSSIKKIDPFLKGFLIFFTLIWNASLMAQSHHEAASKDALNRLADSQSPYLLQHKNNPVDWYEWGEEAFEKARNEDKPVFLSIGYSTCHWCHVMAHESFEDAEVARLMNEAFVSIKVDREERPDIDGIYMTVCQMLTGRGGWPLTIIMTPDQKPFFAATYIPKESRWGRTGMLDLVPRIRKVWKEQRDEVNQSAEGITEALREAGSVSKGTALGPDVLETAFEQLASRHDAQEGGFGDAPKFPTPHNLLFLLRYGARSGNSHALAMVERTLEAMRRGGIYDHLGYGFHRYSTDRYWLVPHFEKMLYDQAQLAGVYIEAFQITGKETFQRTAEEIFEYVLRDMTSPEGGFYSAEDADSEGEEGKFYVWTEEEIRKVLEPADADFVIQLFRVEAEGNFSEEASGQKTGANILHRSEPLGTLAGQMDLSLDELKVRLERARSRLFEHREKRIHPYKDDKILTDWNGLMIAALSRGAFVFREPRYLEAAERAADFILENLRDSDGRLLHRYRNGRAGITAHAEDYAFLVHGLIELYEAGFDVRHLRAAKELNEELIRHYWDEGEGGFFFTADDSEALIVRRKEIDDSAIPSGNSMALLNLLRLGRMLGEPELEAKAAELNNHFSGYILRYPAAFTQFLVGLDFATSSSRELVLAGRAGAPDVREMMEALSRRYLPHLVILFRPQTDEEPEIVKLAAFTRDQVALDGRATAYVCSDYRCEKPTTDPNEMLHLLER